MEDENYEVSAFATAEDDVAIDELIGEELSDEEEAELLGEYEEEEVTD